MPTGYSEAMCIFTKIIKPFFSVFRKQGLLLIAFADDSIYKVEQKSSVIKVIMQK